MLIVILLIVIFLSVVVLIVVAPQNGVKWNWNQNLNEWKSFVEDCRITIKPLTKVLTFFNHWASVKVNETNPSPFLCLNLPSFNSSSHALIILNKSCMIIYEKFCGGKQYSSEFKGNLQVWAISQVCKHNFKVSNENEWNLYLQISVSFINSTKLISVSVALTLFIHLTIIIFEWKWVLQQKK